MQKILKRIALILAIITFYPGLHAQKLSDAEIESKIDALLAKMTLEEKAAQLVNIGLPAILYGDYWSSRDSAKIDTARMAKLIGQYGLGCVHNTPSYPAKPGEWYRIVKQIQDYAMKHSPHGIPIIYGIDDIHGANYVLGSTLFPSQIALAATWDPSYSFVSSEITSYESRAASLPWNYNPNVDVSTQPLWGRISESFGEDPYLVGQMGAAYVKGSQHFGLEDKRSTAICLKHYLGYGGATNGKDRANSVIPESYLRQYYLEPFRTAIDSGALSVMLSSNSINGIPNHSNKYLITDVLKGELGFKGIVVSDFSDLNFLFDAHHTAADMREAVKMAFNAGMDMAMTPFDNNTIHVLVDLVKSNEIPVSRIDDAARRVLRVKFGLNLFEKPYVDPKEYPDFASKKFMDENYKAASEAITLLKNDNVLPLKAGKKVLVTGYAANSINMLNGAWSRSFLGRDTRYNDPSKLTILGAIQQTVGKENVLFAEGTDYEKDIDTKSAVEKAKNVDVIVVCLGEIPATEKPSDINTMDMPEAQQNLVKALAETGKPIILVLVEGRPRLIEKIEPLAKAIVMAYYIGDEGGRAITDALYGKINPSGKLPYTYPKYSGNILPYYHKLTDIRDVNWGFNGFYPQYEFGFGLSYTEFEYTGIKISSDTLKGNADLNIEITLKNTGKIAGKEVVQCYIHDVIASVAPDVKKLVRFKKVELKPGEQQTVKFSINKKDLAFVGMDNKWITEPGKFQIFSGSKSSKLLVKEFWWKE